MYDLEARITSVKQEMAYLTADLYNLPNSCLISRTCSWENVTTFVWVSNWVLLFREIWGSCSIVAEDSSVWNVKCRWWVMYCLCLQGQAIQEVILRSHSILRLFYLEDEGNTVLRKTTHQTTQHHAPENLSTQLDAFLTIYRRTWTWTV
jgi:hypothetical protein